MKADPVEEYVDAMRRMTLDHARQLLARGIPMRSITIACPAPMRLRRFGDRYVPDASGSPAWIIPVCVSDPQCPWDIEVVDPIRTVSVGAVIDLLAFSPLAPGRWALRFGKAVALGAIPPQHICPDLVRVFRDVTDWLRCGCEGLVPLTRNVRTLYHLLSVCRAGVIAQDEKQAAGLRAILGWPGRVTVRPILERRHVA